MMSDEPCLWRCDHRIPSDAGAGRRVLDEVLAQLDAQHWGRQDRFAVHLAMEEALVNAIVHGNRLAADKRVHVICTLTPRRIRIEIADEGPGFDPRHVADPTCADHLLGSGGRGVMLIRAFMTRVQYNDLGNCVVMEKDRAGAKGEGRRAKGERRSDGS